MVTLPDALEPPPFPEPFRVSVTWMSASGTRCEKKRTEPSRVSQALRTPALAVTAKSLTSAPPLGISVLSLSASAACTSLWVVPFPCYTETGKEVKKVDKEEMLRIFAAPERVAEAMARKDELVELPDPPEPRPLLSKEETAALLDACNHSKNSYTEEMMLDALNDFVERYDENQKAQEKENRENRRLTITSICVGVVAAIFGGASFIVAAITLILQLSK